MLLVLILESSGNSQFLIGKEIMWELVQGRAEEGPWNLYFYKSSGACEADYTLRNTVLKAGKKHLGG